MFHHLSDLTKAAVFYLIAFGLALIVTLLPLGGDASQMLSMLTPTVAVLLMLLVMTPDGRTRAAWLDLGLHRSGRQLWGFAILAPVLIMAVAYVVVWLTPFATPTFPADQGIVDIAFNTVINFAITLVFAAGEEIGWRGYLLLRLLGLGARRATLLTGLLQGIWHLPLLLLTPFYHGAGDRRIVVPLFLLSLTLAGPIYGYLRLMTGSVWPPVIAHASLNVAWSLFDQFTTASSPVAVEYLAGESGLLPLLGYAVVAAWCLYRMPTTPRDPAATATSPAPAAAPMTG